MILLCEFCQATGYIDKAQTIPCKVCDGFGSIIPVEKEQPKKEIEKHGYCPHCKEKIQPDGNGTIHFMCGCNRIN